MQIILLIALLLLFATFFIIDTVTRIKEKDMTKDKLITECKKLIDKKNFKGVESLIRRHLKIFIIHNQEIVTAVTDYARELDGEQNN